jgi:hypothetical protein
MGAPGCDDAPVVDIRLQDAAREFTLIMPYYENPEFLRYQLDRWRVLPVVLRENVELVLVDDASPAPTAADVLHAYRTMSARSVQFDWYGALPFRTRVFRVEQDVRWNWLAARNIGAHHASEGWVMLTDMDHVLPEHTLRTLVHGEFDEGTIYRFSRVGAKTHPHPNSWWMTRRMYWRIGGYDEALSGHYGTDGEYRRRCASTAQIRIMRDPLELHEHELDASTASYKRKQPEDARGKQMIKARGKGWAPRVLSFPYHQENLR